MTVFEVLRRKHRELDAALDAIERTESFADAEQQFLELATRIVAFLRAERSVVYPQMARAESGMQFEAHELAQATRYQDRIERAVDHLRLGGLCEGTWRAAVRSLRDQIADLASFEEWVVFPFASLALSTTELCHIAGELLAYEPVAMRFSCVTITYDAPTFEPVKPTVAIVPPAELEHRNTERAIEPPSQRPSDITLPVPPIELPDELLVPAIEFLTEEPPFRPSFAA